MCSHLHHAALVDDGDAVSGLDGGQSVSDDDARASLASLVQRFLYNLHVNITGGLETGMLLGEQGEGGLSG